MADADVREEVRARYAAAATAVSATGRDALAVVDADQCCTPSAWGRLRRKPHEMPREPTPI